MTAAKDLQSISSVLRFDGPLPEPQVYRPAAERILGGDPVQTAWTLHSTADNRYHSGIWQCEPGKWRVVFTETEFCQITQGKLVITAEDGSETTLRAGDAFISPAGFTGIWDVKETTRKLFAYYE